MYLGEFGNRRGIAYNSRRLDTENGITVGQSFIFRAEEAGTFILKFYRQDFIQNYIINDYVQVIVGENYENTGRAFFDRGRIIAEPRWPPLRAPVVTGPVEPHPAVEVPSATAPVRPVEEQEQPVRVTEPQAVPQDSVSPRGTPSPDEFVRQAKAEYETGRIEQALAVLDLMRSHYPMGTDEAWWLYGQLLEAPGTNRDIRQAIEYYRRLVNEYPQSSRVAEARARITYLERFYFNIR